MQKYKKIDRMTLQSPYLFLQKIVKPFGYRGCNMGMVLLLSNPY